MSIVTIHEARTDLSKLLRKVAAGEEVIIARGSGILRASAQKRVVSGSNLFCAFYWILAPCPMA